MTSATCLANEHRQVQAPRWTSRSPDPAPHRLAMVIMTSNSPHYLLFAEASSARCSLPTWRFVLQNVESQRRFAASDSEPCDCGERLELLAVVRGLEALDGPARVTLVTKSRYVNRGIKQGLSEWRANHWQWERFGRIVPVRDSDLWQRVDRALQFHELTCQHWHFEEAVDSAGEWESASSSSAADAPSLGVLGRRLRVDPSHGSGPRIVHPVERLRRQARARAAKLGETLRTARGAFHELAGAAG